MGRAKAVVGQPRRDISRVRRMGTAPPASLLVACLWLAALLAYSNSFRGELVMDSRGLILDDSRVHAATSANVRGILTGEYWSTAAAGGLYRPLTKLTYLFNYAILGSGPSPAGYHWVNFLIHGVNMTLAYWLGLVLFKQSWHAFALAGFWGLHPLLTEWVTNVVGGADLLGGAGRRHGHRHLFQGKRGDAGRRDGHLRFHLPQIQLARLRFGCHPPRLLHLGASPCASRRVLRCPALHGQPARRRRFLGCPSDRCESGRQVSPPAHLARAVVVRLLL